MAKQNKQNNQNNQPQPETVLAEGETVVNAAEAAEASAEIVDLQQRQGRRINALDAINANQSEVLQNKVQLIEQTESAIADVVKLAGNRERNEADERKLTEAASKAGFLLYRGRINGLLTADEASELLGRSFGWKTKQNGEASKTPFGTGEDLRKRVVRAVNAHAFAVRGAEPTAFFEPLSRGDVKPLLSEMEAGKRTIWQLFRDLSEMKAEASGSRPKPAFNPKTVIAMAGTLGENVGNTLRIIHETPGLLEAYAGLQRMMDTVFTEYTAKYPKDVEAA